VNDSSRQTGPRVVVWQWGRYGAGPRIAALLAEGFRRLGDAETTLSLSSGAEILNAPSAPRCDLPVATYTNVLGLVWRLVLAPLTFARLVSRLRSLRPVLGVCAMPGPLDLVMVAALHRVGAHVAVVVHDASEHPGDRFPLLLKLQKALLRRSDLVIALSRHVASALKANGALPPGIPVVVSALPPLALDQATPPGTHSGPRRVLCFGRLRAYKGLDLLAEALSRLGPRRDMEVRIVGQGPESAALVTLRSLPGVRVENRWVPEAEVDALLNWADIVVLPYREASQSGVAPTALAAGRHVVATRVGGLAEQVEGAPRAILCEPEAASLAAALARALHHANEPAAPAADGAGSWRCFAARVLIALGHGLSPPVGCDNATGKRTADRRQGGQTLVTRER
jgi:glycosyltransferase involved in cell wall biosynthesis